MVLYFTVCDPDYIVYCGLDKFENELLIKYAWPEDAWFHVDSYSSAHYYLRLKTGETLDDIPDTVLEDIAQMTKESSKDGKKVDNVKVVYTMASNLRKSNDMDTGEVGYHNRTLVKSTMVKEKKKDILNRLIKTREDREVDLNAELQEHLHALKNRTKRLEREQKEQAKKDKEEKRKLKEQRDYSGLMSKMDDKNSNQFREEEDEEDDSTFIGGGRDATLDAFM
jgi:hypothetical protein